MDEIWRKETRRRCGRFACGLEREPKTGSCKHGNVRWDYIKRWEHEVGDWPLASQCLPCSVGCIYEGRLTEISVGFNFCFLDLLTCVSYSISLSESVLHRKDALDNGTEVHVTRHKRLFPATSVFVYARVFSRTCFLLPSIREQKSFYFVRTQNRVLRRCLGGTTSPLTYRDTLEEHVDGMK